MQFRPSGFNVLPEVVKNLLIINGLFFLATITLDNVYHIDLTDKLGLHYWGSDKFRPYQIVTYMFMHGGFSHLFFNMFAVWMFGNALENVWGPKRFLTYYLLTGFGAAIIHYAIVYWQMHPTLEAINNYVAAPSGEALTSFLESTHFKLNSVEMQSSFHEFTSTYNKYLQTGEGEKALTASVDYLKIYEREFMNQPNIVGASGALFGLLLAFGMLFPNSLIYVYFAIPVKAKYFVMLYGALELYSGFQDNPADNVAHFAHLGGMVFGFILLRYWKKKGF